MEPIEVIMTRRMVAKVSDVRPERAEIEVLLDAAVRAPTHHLTQPWRFLVLSGEALDALGEAMAERARVKYAGAPDLEEKLAFERSRPRRAPVIIVVIYRKSDHPKAVEVEDRYAVGAAVQNILLAAHASGLGAYWRTGPASEDPGVMEHLGLGDGEEIAAFVYVGRPAETEPAVQTRRSSAGEITTWRGWS